VSRGFFWRFAVLLIVLSTVYGFAQNPVRLELVSFKVVTYKTDDGKLAEKLTTVSKVAPGDVLEWRLRAENTSSEKLAEVALIIPIPPQTYYLEGSASPLLLEQEGQKKIFIPEFSYDGGVNYGTPPLYKTVTEVVDGKEIVKKVVVPPEEYTHARWVVDYLLPGEVVEVSLRTKVR